MDQIIVKPLELFETGIMLPEEDKLEIDVVGEIVVKLKEMCQVHGLVLHKHVDSNYENSNKFFYKKIIKKNNKNGFKKILNSIIIVVFNNGIMDR